VPRIFLAGVGPLMTAVAGEVADGYFVHPFHTREFIEQVTLPSLEKGFAKSGRSRDDCEVSAQCIIAAGDTEEELRTAMQGAKAQISFYGSTPAYRGVLESIGMGGLQDELNLLSKKGGWLEMAARIDDDLLGQIAVVGSRSEIPGLLQQRFGKWADRISLVAPFAPDEDNWRSVVLALHAESGSA
jgi:probable F420-dependent oxidoreductase